jgi:hypothetical protein
VMTFYCKEIPGDTDQTRRICAAMKQLAENPAKYQQDTAKGSPALSLAAAARRPNIVVTREDHPFGASSTRAQVANLQGVPIAMGT